jgi:hypothetical protein
MDDHKFQRIRLGRPGDPEAVRRETVARYAARQPVRLGVTTDEESFPDEFRDVLEVKILEYQEIDGVLAGAKMRLLRPIWTLVPKDLDPQFSLDLCFPPLKFY